MISFSVTCQDFLCPQPLSKISTRTHKHSHGCQHMYSYEPACRTTGRCTEVHAQREEQLHHITLTSLILQAQGPPREVIFLHDPKLFLFVCFVFVLFFFYMLFRKRRVKRKKNKGFSLMEDKLLSVKSWCGSDSTLIVWVAAPPAGHEQQLQLSFKLPQEESGSFSGAPQQGRHRKLATFSCSSCCRFLIIFKTQGKTFENRKRELPIYHIKMFPWLKKQTKKNKALGDIKSSK